ncbi:hypothetical protein AB1Y20_012731 [Prymnesium parvum]|uniref:Ribosome assembly protein 1 n=1 Tax=Prymnesium parvum TaxID=97485 RepID=A0AB34IK67_PRYPA
MSSARNVCIIAHVDHGKTTVADSLLASNGIVSSRLAGLGLRYMDSREDEQDRGITMKASCIALAYQADGGSPRHEINLIDSPGHVDFSSEVSAAVRLADGALVVVDVVEGVCVQTHAVIKQAWEENVRPVLVLNKIDRLILDLQFSPHEAWEHIKQVVQSVNAITGHLYAGAVLEAQGTFVSDQQPSTSTPADDDAMESAEGIAAERECLVQEVQFAPEKGNVVFASAMHGWAFDLKVFAQLYAKKLGIREHLLQQTLWGEFFFHPKAKKIMRSSLGGKLKPMFVQFVLQTIWQVYGATFITPDETQRSKIISTLCLSVPAKELGHPDPLVQLRGIMGQWLPLGRTLLRVVTEQLPTAAQAQAHRLAQLCPELKTAQELQPAQTDVEGYASFHANEHLGAPQPGALPALADTSDPETEETGRMQLLSKLRRGFEHCESTGPLILYVAKVVCTHGVAGAHVGDAFIGFVRVFCGTLRPSEASVLHVCGPRSESKHQGGRGLPVNQLRVYKLMGRDLVTVEYAEAGSICGVGGLGPGLFKGATLSTELRCPPLARMSSEAAPIVQVAVEPTQLANLPQLERGLRMLAMADPSVEVAQLETGEHVLRTCGEVHLERCLVDLRTAFAVGAELVVSPPMVSVLETVAPGGCGRARASVANKLVVNVRAQPLAVELAEVLTANRAAFRFSLQQGICWLGGTNETSSELQGLSLLSALQCLSETMGACGNQWVQLTPLAAAPVESCDNLLLCSAEATAILHNREGRALLASLISGFQLAAYNGPLCEERMKGVAFVLESLDLQIEDDEISSGQLAGQSITAMRDACRSAFLASGTRVLEPVYLCELQTTQDIMGKTYGVLSRRRARVLAEEMREGTPIFTIRAYLPVAESFGFAGELRKTTSGAAHPQLVFSHFEAMQQDPLFVITTEADQEALDDGTLPSVNVARGVMNDIRRRKGLLVDEDRVVQSATKQRTLAKKK